MKLTPEIKRFIEDNNRLNARALSGLIESKFKIKISHVSIAKHLQKARSDAQASNAAKIEAVRSKILDDADEWANKYLRYLDEEVESLRKLKDSGKLTYIIEGAANRTVEVTDIKDRMAISQTLHKYLTTVIEFVKPNSENLPDDDLDAKLERLIAKRKA